MSSNVNDPQDDPKLKSAVKRCWMSDCAPAGLRRKIEQILATEGALDSVAAGRRSGAARSSAGRRKALWSLAMAASVFLVFGYFFFHPSRSDAALPDYVATAFVQTHDRCCRHADHHFLKGVPPDDFAAISKKLSTDLSVPVISTSMDGWTFTGAGPCPVWGHESAHLMYRKGNLALSVFTIPITDLNMKPGDAMFATSVEGHNISAFIKGNGLYCVVESATDGSNSPGDTRQMRDHLKDTFPASCAMAGCHCETVAER
jgi:hypothetical protein